MKKYFDNEAVNIAFNACFVFNPKTATNVSDDNRWYEFFSLLFENCPNQSYEFLEEKLEQKGKDIKGDEAYCYCLSDDTVKSILRRYVDLLGFYKYITRDSN